MSWLLYSIYLSLILALIYRSKFFRLEEWNRLIPVFFFLVKIIAAFAVWWVYSYHYTDRKTSDIWKYFDDSKVMYDAVHAHPADFFRMVSGIGDDDPRIVNTYYHQMNYWYQQFDNNLLNDAHIIIRVNAALRLVSLGNYHIHALFMCLLAFTGLMWICKALLPFSGEQKKWLPLFIFLLPSLTFWSSGVLKEGIMLFALGGIVWQSFRFFADKKTVRFVSVFLFAWLLFITKFYVLAALIPSLAGMWWTRTNEKRAVLKFMTVLIIFGAAGLSLKYIRPTYDPLSLLSHKQQDMLHLARGGTWIYNDTVVSFIASDHRDDVQMTGDSVYHIRHGADYYYWYTHPDFGDTFFVKNSHDDAAYKMLTDFPRAGSLTDAGFLQPTLKSFLAFTPGALVRAQLRPWPWEGKNIMLLFPAVENLLPLLLLFLILSAPRRPEFPSVAGFCFTFAFLLLLVMGLTTPVLGTLVRYRIAAQPFLLAGMLLFIDRKKLAARFRKKA